ncbi:MAG TPA: aminopeptidase P N-terminal domain-containing protein [Anaeromyxobacteraceae bacterium]|nr:aminopeptidase P N-terminal domain-containing protein [Anaeromyxobacteraceae bacterium]
MPFDLATHARRRASIAELMRARGGGVLLLPAAEERMRNADAEYLFRQDSDFAYVTGFDEPSGCALLLVPPSDGATKLVMFVRPKDREKEIWTGFRAGVEGAKGTYGADEAYTVEQIDEKLPGFLDRTGPLWFRLGQSREWDERVSRMLRDLRARARLGVEAPSEVIDPARAIHELRLVKDPEELAMLRQAAEITAEAHLAAMRDGHEGRREYQVQAEIEYAFRRRGGTGPGYGTIVATGANSCILHYRAGDALLKDGDVCLVDAGGEYGWYTADVTRTFPVSGEFTKTQRALYDVVLEAQLAAIDAVRPGATVDAIHELTVRKLTEGMIRVGLLQGNVDERIADKAFRRYYMHRTSHWLGLDVHDAGAYTTDGKSRPLVPGMVLTVEPGLYVAADDASAPAEMRGVGIRIEDDVLVTEGGHENLTYAVPKDPREVELACTR